MHGDTPELPREIRLERLPDGLRYRLPPRPTGPLRFVGLFPLAIGVLFAAAPAVMLARNIASSGWSISLIPIAALAFLFAVGGISAIAMGAFILAGRTDVVLDRRGLRRIERAGPFRWTRRRPVERLRSLRILGADGTEGTAFTDLSALSAGFDGAREMFVAIGYPRPWLAAVAASLREHTGTRIADDRGEPVGEVTITDTMAEPTTEERVEEPEETTIRMETTSDGLTITVPRAGVWKGSKGMFAFSLLWTGFTAVFGVFTVVVPLASGKGLQFPFLFGTVLFMGIGLTMLLFAVNAGRRLAVLDVVGDTLLVNRQSLFGLRQHEWRRERLRRVSIGPSGVEINDRPVMELQVVDTDDRKTGLLSERSDDEIRWVAHLVRRGLGMTGPSATEENSDAGM